MDISHIPPVEPDRPGSFGDLELRPIILGAFAAMVVSGALVTVAAVMGTLTAVVATANTSESASRPGQVYLPGGCGLASR